MGLYQQRRALFPLKLTVPPQSGIYKAGRKSVSLDSALYRAFLALVMVMTPSFPPHHWWCHNFYIAWGPDRVDQLIEKRRWHLIETSPVSGYVARGRTQALARAFTAARLSLFPRSGSGRLLTSGERELVLWPEAGAGRTTCRVCSSYPQGKGENALNKGERS